MLPSPSLRYAASKAPPLPLPTPKTPPKTTPQQQNESYFYDLIKDIFILNNTITAPWAVFLSYEFCDPLETPQTRGGKHKHQRGGTRIAPLPAGAYKNIGVTLTRPNQTPLYNNFVFSIDPVTREITNAPEQKDSFMTRFSQLPNDIKTLIYNNIFALAKYSKMHVGKDEPLQAVIEANNILAALKLINQSLSENANTRPKYADVPQVLPGLQSQWERYEYHCDKYNEWAKYLTSLRTPDVSGPITIPTFDKETPIPIYTLANNVLNSDSGNLVQQTKAIDELVDAYNALWLRDEASYNEDVLYATSFISDALGGSKHMVPFVSQDDYNNFVQKLPELFHIHMHQICLRYFEKVKSPSSPRILNDADYIHEFGYAAADYLADTVNYPHKFYNLVWYAATRIITETNVLHIALSPTPDKTRQLTCHDIFLIHKKAFLSWFGLNILNPKALTPQNKHAQLARFCSFNLLNYHYNEITNVIQELQTIVNAYTDSKFNKLKQDIAGIMKDATYNMHKFHRLHVDNHVIPELPTLDLDLVKTLDLHQQVENIKRAQAESAKHRKLAIRLSKIITNYIYALSLILHHKRLTNIDKPPYTIRVSSNNEHKFTSIGYNWKDKKIFMNHFDMGTMSFARTTHDMQDLEWKLETIFRMMPDIKTANLVFMHEGVINNNNIKLLDAILGKSQKTLNKVNQRIYDINLKFGDLVKKAFEMSNAPTQAQASPQGGAPPDKLRILGRLRKVYPKASGYAIKYQGELISLTKAKRLEKHFKKSSKRQF